MEKPNYYAVLTAEVRYDNELPAAARLLFAELTALSNMKGYCFATNAYLADIYDVTPRSIKLWLERLKERGHIRVELIKKGEHVTERRIHILTQENSGVGKENSPPREKTFPSPREKTFPLNTTRLNIKDNKAKSVKKAFSKPTIEEVQAHANDKGYKIDPEAFWHYHEARGWELTGGKKMKSWKSAVTTWHKNSTKFGGNVAPISKRMIL